MRSARATRARRSPPAERIWENQRARKSRTAKTSPKVARCAGELLTATHFFFVRLARDGHPKRSGRLSIAILARNSNALLLNRHIGYMDSEIWLFMTRELQACHSGKRCQRTIRKRRAAT